MPGQKTRMWTYGGCFPGPTIRRPAGERTAVTFLHELPRSAGELTVHLHGGHNRTQFDGQPGGLTPSHAASLLLRHPPRPLAAAVGQRRPDRAGGEADLRLRPGRGRPARARRLPVVPRPPPRPHRPQRLARPGRDVDRRRRVRGGPAAAERRARPAADDRRPLLRPPQPADQPLHQPPPARRRDRRPLGPRQRRPHAPPPGQRPALPAAHPQRLAVPLLQPLPLQRRAADPDRHRQRPDAAAGAPRRGDDRAGRAGRAGGRLRRRGGRERRAAQRATPRRQEPARRPHLRRRADAVPRRFAAPPRPHARAAQAAPAAGLDEARLAQARANLGDLDRRRLQDHLADQRPHLQPGPRRRPARSWARSRPGRSSTAPTSPT